MAGKGLHDPFELGVAIITCNHGRCGYRTGIDLDGLLAARRIMESHLNGEPTHGAYVKAGAPKGFRPAA